MQVFAELVVCLLTALAIAVDGHLRYQIEEGVPRRTVVGNVVEDADLRSQYSAADLKVLRFRFLASTPSDSGSGATGRPALFEVAACIYHHRLHYLSSWDHDDSYHDFVL